MDTGEILRQRYGAANVTLKDNGFYYVRTNGKDNCDELFVPQVLDSTTKLYGYLPGAGGSGNDAKQLRELMSGKNPPNCVVAIARKSTDPNNILEQATDVIKASGSQVNGVLVQTFSAGGYNGYVKLDRYIGNHPEVGDSAVLLTIDGGYKGVKTEYRLQLSDLKNLIKYQVPILRQNPGKSVYNIKEGALAGLNIIGVYGWEHTPKTSNGHVAQNINAFDNGIGLYLLGEKDEISAKYYKYYLYDEKTGKVYDVDPSIVEQMRIEGSIGYANLEDATAALFTKAGAFEIKSSLSAASTNNKVLTELNDLSYGKQFGKVATQYDFVLSNINSIRGEVKDSKYLSNLKVQTYRGGKGVPAIINTKIEKYFGVISTLLRNIEKETRAVLTVAEAWMLLDRDIANQLETGKIVELDIPADLDPPKEDPKGNGKKKSPKTPGTKPPTDPDKTKDPDKPDEEEKKEEPKHTVKVEDEKITQQTKDGSTLELDYKDGKVTSIAYKYEYESEAKAQEAVYELIKKYDGCDYISGIYPKGNKIEVIFNENVLSKIDVAKLKESIEKNNDNEKLQLEDLINEYIKGGK